MIEGNDGLGSDDYQTKFQKVKPGTQLTTGIYKQYDIIKRGYLGVLIT